MKRKQIENLCLGAVFAAVIFVFTAYLHIPSHTGYTHIGDAFIYLAASILPTPYACAAGAIGAGLADVLSGYGIWAPGTVIIKAVTALFFTYKRDTILCKRNLVSILPAFAVCVGGYYVYESIITFNWVAPLAGIPGYITQVVLSAVAYLVVGKVLDQARLKARFHLGGIAQ